MYGTVMLTTASGFCFVLNAERTRISRLLQDELRSDESPAEGETVTIKHKGAATVLHAIGDTVHVEFADTTHAIVPLSAVWPVAVGASEASATWPPEIIRSSNPAKLLKRSERVTFSTRSETFTGFLEALDTDRAVVYDESRGPLEAYYVVPLDALERVRRDDDADEEQGPSKRFCSTARFA